MKSQLDKKFMKCGFCDVEVFKNTICNQEIGGEVRNYIDPKVVELASNKYKNDKDHIDYNKAVKFINLIYKAGY